MQRGGAGTRQPLVAVQRSEFPHPFRERRPRRKGNATRNFLLPLYIPVCVADVTHSRHV